METMYFKDYSSSLGRDMEIKVYGHGGRPMIYIPCQDGRFFDFEGFHMNKTLAPWIESGKLMVFSVDTIDKETWSDRSRPAYDRIRTYEAWINYLCYEVVPFAQSIAMERNHWNERPGVLTMGCSLGATHAANLYLRRPDLFDGCLALSGIYTASYGFDDYMDEVVYQNSPVDYMAGMPEGHPYVNMYNSKRAVICCGQGPWEIPDTTKALKYQFERLGANIWVDLWGYDVQHDWCWWYKQAEYFMPYILGEK